MTQLPNNPDNTPSKPPNLSSEKLLQQSLMSLLISLHQWINKYFMWCQRGQPLFLPYSSRYTYVNCRNGLCCSVRILFIWIGCSMAFCGKGKTFQHFLTLLLENLSHPHLLSSFCVERGKELMYPPNYMLCIVSPTSLPGSPWDLKIYISLLLFADCIKDFYLFGFKFSLTS